MDHLSTLSDEDKLILCIQYVACGTDLPASLVDFLQAEGLYEKIVNPQEL